jgi:hypothetical protein
MLVLNGATEPGKAFYIADIRVLAGHVYTFTGWAASWGLDPGGTQHDPSPARIVLKVNGVPTGAAWEVDAAPGAWHKFAFRFKAGQAGTVTLRLEDENTESIGNDFAIDDLAVHLAAR